MFTLGYRFRPWRDGKAIADGPSILRYVRDTASELRSLNKRIRYGHRVTKAEWSSAESQWTIEVEVMGSESPLQRASMADGDTSDLQEEAA